MGMESARVARHSPGLYGMVLVSPRSGGDCCSFFAALRKGDERVWSVGEAVVGAQPEEAAVTGLSRLLDEAVRRRAARLDVFVSEPEVVAMIERRAPVPDSLGPWYLRIRSRCNQLGRVRFVTTDGSARCARRTGSAAPPEEATLFDPAVA